MLITIELDDNSKEVNIPGNNIISEIRIEATKTFNIDVQAYKMLVSGEPVLKSADITEGTHVRFSKKGSGM